MKNIIINIIRIYVSMVFVLGIMICSVLVLNKVSKSNMSILVAIILYIGSIASMVVLTAIIISDSIILKRPYIGMFIRIILLTAISLIGVLSGSCLAITTKYVSTIGDIRNADIILNWLGQIIGFTLMYIIVDKYNKKELSNIFSSIGETLVILSIIIVLIGGKYEMMLVAPLACSYIFSISARYKPERNNSISNGK